MHPTLIDPSTLLQHLGRPAWVIIDCRFDLANPAWGEEQYLAGHVPGAQYAHLDRDLSAPKTGKNGRHPLPSPDEMAARFGRMGVGPDAQVVAYDNDSGMYASRLWWMLRFMGHDAVAVLDGGWARWVREGGATEVECRVPGAAVFAGAPRADRRLQVAEVERIVAEGRGLLVDARAGERFRGESETLDPVAGHIPGAVNAFFQNSLTGDKCFKSTAELREQWTAVLAGRSPQEVVCYCGSGVTACHNLLSLEAAGLPGARLYAGSWSEWCADPARPVER
jgi:thiosulfate/3-mercaptopyruvate sulfurtransferase